MHKRIKYVESAFYFSTSKNKTKNEKTLLPALIEHLSNPNKFNDWEAVSDLSSTTFIFAFLLKPISWSALYCYCSACLYSSLLSLKFLETTIYAYSIFDDSPGSTSVSCRQYIFNTFCYHFSFYEMNRLYR